MKSRVSSDMEGYEYLIRIFHEADISDDHCITLIFTSTYWFEANLAAVLGAFKELLESRGKIVKVYGVSKSIAAVLQKNGFLRHFGYDWMQDLNGTILTYQQFSPQDDDAFMEYIKAELLSKREFPKHSPALGKKIRESIFELYENARTHGRCKQLHVCGQYYPRKNPPRLDMTIVDMGISIKKNVNEFLKGNLSGSKAIEWALQYGHTTKTGTISGGLGLDIMLEFIKLNKGKVQIISSEGYWEFRNGDTLKSNFKHLFPGTIINIEFNLNDDSRYHLKEEIPDEINF